MAEDELEGIPSDYTFCPDHDDLFLAFMQLLPLGTAWDNAEYITNEAWGVSDEQGPSVIYIQRGYEELPPIIYTEGEEPPPIPKQSVIRKFISGIALGYLPFEDAMCESLDEWICKSSDVDIDAWMHDYGIPDNCDIYNQNLCAKVSAKGAATSDYLIGLLQSSGYEAVGRWLTGADQEFPGVYSTFYVTIDTTISPAYQLQPVLNFPLGIGHRLGDVVMADLQCMLERYIPAHCACVVAMAGEFEPESLGVKLLYWWCADDTADGAVTTWLDRIASLDAIGVAATAPQSALEGPNRAVAFDQHRNTHLRTGSVTVSGGPGNTTQYVALWSQQEGIARPADWLLGELNGFIADFLHYENDQRVAVKLAGGVNEYRPDAFIGNGATGPTLVYNSGGILVWTPHNQYIQSQTFDNASWGKVLGTIGTNVETAPNGMPEADGFVINTGLNVAYITQTPTAITGELYTSSVYVKRGTLPGTDWFEIQVRSTGTFRASFNIATGVKGAVNGGPVSSNIADAGNGWWRCDMTVVAGTTNIQTLLVPRAIDNTTAGVTGDGVNPAFYIWGAHANRGYTPTDYLPTTTAVKVGLAIDHNPTTRVPRGLLIENTATNLFIWNSALADASWSKSSVSIIVESMTAPNGRVEADQIVENSGNASHSVTRTTAITVVNATQYTFSIFLKPAGRTWVYIWDTSVATSGAWFDLTGAGAVGTREANNDRAAITALPNGWYRCEIEQTSIGTAGSPAIALSLGDALPVAYTGDGISGVYVWGAQYETGSIATSPIPTFSTTVVRAMNAPFVTPSQIPWNDAEATIHVEYVPRADPVLATYVWEVVLDATHRYALHQIGTSARAINVNVSTDATVNLPAPGTIVPYTRQKITVGIKSNDIAVTHNGSAVAVDTVNSIATGFTRFDFGHSGTTAVAQLNGWLERIVHVPRKVANADMPTWRYNFPGILSHVIASRGSSSNYRTLGTRMVGEHQQLEVTSDATHKLTDTDTSVTLTGPVIGTAGFEDDRLRGRVQGRYTTPATLAATGTDAATTSPITIGANTATAPGEFFHGNVHHLMVCRNLTAHEYIQLEGWLAWDRGRPDILDGNHPYRNIRP